MALPKIDMSAPISKNLEIIYGGDNNLNCAAEAKLAKAFLKLAKPKISGDEIRINSLKQALENYYAVGESAVLAHYTKSAYHYIAEKGGKFVSKIQNFLSRKTEHLLAQNK